MTAFKTYTKTKMNSFKCDLLRQRVTFQKILHELNIQICWLKSDIHSECESNITSAIAKNNGCTKIVVVLC